MLSRCVKPNLVVKALGVGNRAKSTKSTRKISEVFRPLDESVVTSELLVRFNKDIRQSIHSDLIVVGNGLSGLSCVYNFLKLCEDDSTIPKLKVTMIEKSLHPGGSGWTGSGSFNGIVIRKPAHELLNDLGLVYEDRHENFVVLRNGVPLISALLSKISSSENVTMLNGFQVEEVLIQDPSDVFSHVRGVACDMVGNFPYTPSQYSPLFFNSSVIVSSCGHHPTEEGGLRQSLRRYANYGFSEGVTQIHHPNSTSLRDSDDIMVHNTREVSSGLIVCGGQIQWLDGTPGGSGLSLSGKLYSGLKAAEIALKSVLREREKLGTQNVAFETAGHFFHDDSLGHMKDRK
jgi:thiamine thiazole synthase